MTLQEFQKIAVEMNPEDPLFELFALVAFGMTAVERQLLFPNPEEEFE